jgi:hypothetical protein
MISARRALMLNWSFFLMAYACTFLSIIALGGAITRQPFYDLALQALGATVPAATPIFAIQAWRRRRERIPCVLHHWTVLIVLFLIFGRWYSAAS